MASSNFDVTSANAQLVLTVDELYPSGIQLQQFSADGIFSSDSIEMAETRRSVDGYMVAGVIKNISSVTLTLEASSPSASALEYVRDCMEAMHSNVLHPFAGGHAHVREGRSQERSSDVGGVSHDAADAVGL